MNATLRARLLRLPVTKLCDLAAKLRVAYTCKPRSRNCMPFRLEVIAKIERHGVIACYAPGRMAGADGSVAFGQTHRDPRRGGDALFLRAPSARFAFKVGR